MTTTNTRVRIHLVMGHVVTLATVLVVAVAADLLARPVAAAAALAAMVALVAMLVTRRADEWVSSLWTAGASAGFLGAIGWLLFAPFLEGFLDGLRGEAAAQDLPASAASIVALACFALAFNLKRLRGH